MASFLIVLTLGILATARITRFVTMDKLSEPIRAKIIDRIGHEHLIVYGLHCYMCSSIWIAAAITPPVWFLTHASDILGITAWLGLPLAWLTTAYLASLTIQKEAN